PTTPSGVSSRTATRSGDADGTPYGCFLPDLTRFEGAGPPGHDRPWKRRVRSLLRPAGRGDDRRGGAGLTAQLPARGRDLAPPPGAYVDDHPAVPQPIDVRVEPRLLGRAVGRPRDGVDGDRVHVEAATRDRVAQGVRVLDAVVDVGEQRQL